MSNTTRSRPRGSPENTAAISLDKPFECPSGTVYEADAGPPIASGVVSVEERGCVNLHLRRVDRTCGATSTGMDTGY